MTTYYKFLTADNHGPYSNFQWPVPSGKRPGKWVHTKGELKLCENGIHACERKDLVIWIDAKLFVVETKGKAIHGDDKSVFGSARLVRQVESWNDRTARLFAADCAEHVAHLWQAPRGVTWKPADTIAVVRRYAIDEASDGELQAARAAVRAAWAAARAAVGDAAWASARAARAAVGDAAWAAGAAGDAERQWQTAKLAEYLEIDQ